MTYKKWMDETRLGRMAVRSLKLRAVDTALSDYERTPSQQNAQRLWNALVALVGDRGPEAVSKDPRYQKGSLEKLLGEIKGRVGLATIPQDLREELLKVAQGRIRAQIFGGEAQQTVVGDDGVLNRLKIKKIGHVLDSDFMLKIVAEKIEQNLDCKISYGPIKTLKSASRKVADEYGGDWYQVKDAVRITVIATNSGLLTPVPQAKLDAVEAKIRSVCVQSRGLSLIKAEVTTPTSNDCGYSGMNFVVRLSPGGDSNLTGFNFGAPALGWPGEIQANIPAMMYGKMSEEDMCIVFDRSGYNTLKAELDIEGGLGHIFYEIWRVDKQGTNGKLAKELSNEYYNYLRQPNPAEKRALVEKLEKFKVANKAQFAHKG